MWNIEKVSIQNFKSYDYEEIVVQQWVTTLINGTNLDDPGSPNNGSGKSAILDAIRIGLLNQTAKGLIMSDYIKDGSESANIELSLSNDALGHTMVVNRTFFRSNSKKSLTTLVFDGELKTNLIDTKDIDSFIVQEIGVDRNDLMTYFLIGQGEYQSFFSAGDAYQKQVISRLSGVNRLDKLDSLLGTKLEKLELDQANYSERIDSLEVRKTDLRDLIAALSVGKQEARKAQIQEIRNIMDVLKGQVLDDAEELKNTMRDLEKIQQNLESEVAKANKIKAKQGELADKKKKVEAAKKSFRVKLSNISGKINKMRTLIQGSVECPKCHHVFNASDLEQSVEEMKGSLKIHIDTEDEINKKIGKIDIGLEKLSSMHQENQKVLQAAAKLRQQVDSKKNRVESLREEVKRKKTSFGQYKDQLSNLIGSKVEVNKKAIEEKKTQLTQINKEILEIRKNKQPSLVKKLEMLNFWKLHFSKKGFRTFLVNKTLAVIAGHVNTNLERFKTNIRINISGYKKLANGELREKISVNLERDGSGSWQKFKRHSGGQKARVDVCGILSFHHLINEAAPVGRGLNFLSLDETFSFMDDGGNAHVVEILDKSGVTCMIVSQNVMHVSHDNVLEVELKNGNSTIVNGKVQ
jgi:DNA repair exonuclease SbcCD ATPase subunit